MTSSASPLSSAISNSNIHANGNATFGVAGRDVIVYNGLPGGGPSQEKRERLSKISNIDFKAIQRDIFSKVMKNTAGAGKTFLSSIAVNDLQRQAAESSDITVIFAYCRFERNYSERDILAALARQLSENSTQLYEHLQQIHYEDEGSISVHDARDALKWATIHWKKVFIILDGLDELRDEVRYDLVEYLSDLHALTLLTSRPIHLLENMQVDIHVKANEDDVKTFLREGIKRLPKLRGSLRSKVQGYLHVEKAEEKAVKQMAKKADGMFLLAQLQLSALKNVLTINKLLSAIKGLPATISNYYDDTLLRISQQDQDETHLALRALVWVAHSRRLLKVSELLLAIAAEPGCSSLEENDLISDTTLLSICYGLLSINEEDNTVSLIHYTAYEYFVSRMEAPFSAPHELIANSCAVYLGICTKKGESWPTDSEATEELRSRCVFWSYCCAHFGYHIAHAVQRGNVPEHAMDLLYSTRTMPLQSTEGDYRWCDHGSAVHFLAKHGILRTLDCFPDSPSAESQHLGLTPLMYAAGNGHSAVVKTLLQSNKAKINHVSTLQRSSALARACVGGHIDIVEYLLRVPNISINTLFFGEPILHAIIQHHAQNQQCYAIIESLLNHRNAFQLRSESHSQTTLHCAARYGDVAIFKLLLENGYRSMINELDHKGRTPLDVAKKELCNIITTNGGKTQLGFLSGSKHYSRVLHIAPNLNTQDSPATGNQKPSIGLADRIAPIFPVSPSHLNETGTQKWHPGVKLVRSVAYSREGTIPLWPCWSARS